MEPLNIGQPAPMFTLKDSENIEHTLEQYRGFWVVLYFYPKDNTPGCTQEACQFRDDFTHFQAINTVVLGISTDNPASHARFRQQRQLPFPLLADTDGAVSKRYGALFKLGPIQFSKRHSFIIDPNGTLVKIYRKVKPSSHSQNVIEDLKYLSTL